MRGFGQNSKVLAFFFSAHNFYIYELKFINQKLLAWVSVRLKQNNFQNPHYS